MGKKQGKVNFTVRLPDAQVKRLAAEFERAQAIATRVGIKSRISMTSTLEHIIERSLMGGA